MHKVDLLEDRWDQFAHDTETTIKTNADYLKSELVGKFQSGLTGIQSFTNQEIRPAIKQGYEAISEAFDEALTDAQDGFGNVLI